MEVNPEDDLEDGSDEENASMQPPPFSGRSVLPRDQQATLFEILKCAVCLEIPKGKPNLQVKTCEKGHHFCMSCHKKLKSCAICRGRLFCGRNFAVEELISKLGGTLGVNKLMLPKPNGTPCVPPGRFPCPHNCACEIPAVDMLPHIRRMHADHLTDNLRSNPYTESFDWMLKVVYRRDGVTAFSVQVSDYGLNTIIVKFEKGNMHAWVQTLCLKHTSDFLCYKMTLRHSNSDFALNQAPVLGYFAPEGTPKFNVPAHLLPKVDTELEIFVSVWRTDVERKKDIDFEAKPIVPEDPVVFSNDRISRRNRSRHLRKKRLKARLRQLDAPATSSTKDGEWEMDQCMMQTL